MSDSADAEKAAREFTKHHQACVAASQEAFLAGAKWQSENPGWVDVRERLPEDPSPVIGHRLITGISSIVFFSSEGRWMFAYEAEYASDITHWLALPKPPERGKV